MKTRTALATLLLGISMAARATADPPERVARISFVGGVASFRSATAIDWSPVTLNYPLTIGDHVWTDRAGRLELTMGATAIDFDAMTAASLLNLDHHVVQLRVAQGTAIARVRELAGDESLEIDTPNGSVTLLRPGLYRVDVTPAGDATTVTVRRGDVEISAGASAYPVHAGQSLSLVGIDRPSSSPVATLPFDEFDDWALVRDRRVETLTAVRYVPRTMVGYEDLDDFGTWHVVADYGPVWVPHVRVGWAPYRFGHWAWVDPWGWTWIDDAPWGFAPFHYGRWAYVGDGWAWVPGTIVARPVYAPALVAFVGGSNWRVGVSVGAPIGWFPLGPREVFVPAYTVSQTYVAAMNRPHVAVTTVNVNVTNVTYVNRTAPGAVTVVSRETFTQARPVAAAAVNVNPQALSAAVVVGHAAPREVTPAVVARGAAAPAPPPAVVSRTVVVRRSAPAAAAAAGRTVVAPASVPASPQAPAPTPVQRVSPNPVAADLAARHAQERADIEARHAQERAELQARHQEEARAAHAQQSKADLQARHAHEQQALDARQKKEHDEMQKRQAAERRKQ